MEVDDKNTQALSLNRHAAFVTTSCVTLTTRLPHSFPIPQAHFFVHNRPAIQNWNLNTRGAVSFVKALNQKGRKGGGGRLRDSSAQL